MDSCETLYELMSEISEELFFASWMEGLEYILWSIVENDENFQTDSVYFQEAFNIIKEMDSVRLKELSTKYNGWYTHGYEFIPLDKWQKIYSNYIRKKKKDVAI